MSENETLNETLNEQLKESLKLPDLQNMYVNGFITAIGNGDIVILLKNNNKPTATLNLSYTVAKSLCQSLGVTISNLESKTGNTIMTTDDVNKAMSKDSEQ
jgi:hypothetical protein